MKEVKVCSFSTVSEQALEKKYGDPWKGLSCKDLASDASPGESSYRRSTERFCQPCRFDLSRQPATLPSGPMESIYLAVERFVVLKAVAADWWSGLRE